MGESLHSVHDLIVKYQRVRDNSQNSRYWFISAYSPHSSIIGNPTLWFLSRMYVFMRGSVKYAVEHGYGVVSSATFPTFSGPQFGSTGAYVAELPAIYGALHTTRILPNCMIHVPYYEHSLFIPTTPAGEFSFPAYEALGASYTSPGQDIYNGFMAAGGDFMFAYLVPPPR